MILPMKKYHLLLASFAVASAFWGGSRSFSQAQPAASATVNRVPFEGCASDGQVGPLKAPAGKNHPVSIPVAAAQRLSYYKAEDGPGVLAPRGWHCFSTYGSNGSSLFVSPDPIDSKMLFSDDWKGFPGQAIQISFSIGDTSGRFEVAKIVARVFPAYKAFAQSVIAEGLRPASGFPFGPYANDKLTYRGKNVVEFVTPANTKGLGSDSWLLPSATPIDGVAIIIEGETDLIQLSARLSTKDRNLIPLIIRQVEREAQASQ